MPCLCPHLLGLSCRVLLVLHVLGVVAALVLQPYDLVPALMVGRVPAQLPVNGPGPCCLDARSHCNDLCLPARLIRVRRVHLKLEVATSSEGLSGIECNKLRNGSRTSHGYTIWQPLWYLFVIQTVKTNRCPIACISTHFQSRDLRAYLPRPLTLTLRCRL